MGAVSRQCADVAQQAVDRVPAPPRKNGDVWAKYFVTPENRSPNRDRDDASAYAPTSTGPDMTRAGGRVVRPVVSDELAQALAKLAAECAPPPITTAPFVSVAQRERVMKATRRRQKLRIVALAALAGSVLMAAHVSVTRFVFREPAASALQAHAHIVAKTVLPIYSSDVQPLGVAGFTTVLRDRANSGELRFFAEITLRLREPLYTPANTNGTVAYRQLQTSLHLARTQDIKHRLFDLGEGPTPPELPPLVEVAHRPGDVMVVRVPFSAKRVGWTWRLLPPQLAYRTASSGFVGIAASHYARTPHLVFGFAGSTATIRALTKAARDYIVAVNKQLQLKANAAPSSPVNPGQAMPLATPTNAAALPGVGQMRVSDVRRSGLR